MAEAATITVEPDKKKKKKKKVAGATVRVKVKRAKKGTSDKKTEPKAKRKGGFDGLAKLIDYPMVADLLAAGAIAAVAAITEHRMDKKGQTSSKLVKSAGKAAAAAMGKKLMSDIGAIKDAATGAAKKA